MVYVGLNLLRDSPRWPESLYEIHPFIIPSYFQHLNSNALLLYISTKVRVRVWVIRVGARVIRVRVRVIRFRVRDSLG